MSKKGKTTRGAKKVASATTAVETGTAKDRLAGGDSQRTEAVAVEPPAASTSATTRSTNIRQTKKKAAAAATSKSNPIVVVMKAVLQESNSTAPAASRPDNTEEENKTAVNTSKPKKMKDASRSRSLLRSPYELRSGNRALRKRSKSEEPVPVSFKKPRVQTMTSRKPLSRTGSAKSSKLTKQQAETGITLSRGRARAKAVAPAASEGSQQKVVRAAKSRSSRKGRQATTTTSTAPPQPPPSIDEGGGGDQEKEDMREDAVVDNGAQEKEPQGDVDVPEDVAMAEEETATTTQGRKAGQKGGAQRQTRKRAAPAEAVIKKKPKVALPVPKIPAKEGIVLTLGQGDVGQLGLGPDVTEKLRPAVVSFDEPIVFVAAGGMHTACLSKNGEVFTFGCNDEGALGRETEGKEELEMTPGKVSLPEKVVRISAGDSHTVALTEAGHVFVWGNFRDSSGAMGLTSSGAQKTPLRILEDVTIVDVASGSDHVACLSEEGRLYTFGCGEQGQLGRISEDCVKRGGAKGIDLLLKPSPVKIADSEGAEINVDRAWCETYATFARANQDIYAFGLNNFGQLGMSPRSGEESQVHHSPELVPSFQGKKWVEICGGQHHTLALDDQGQVYAMGRKEYGRLGLGDECEDKDAPTVIPALESVKCSSISCGNVVSFAISDSGMLYSWGMGTSGDLGHGHQDDVTTPCQVKSKSLEGRTVLQVSGGGQHSVILATAAAASTATTTTTTITTDATSTTASTTSTEPKEEAASDTTCEPSSETNK